MRSSGEEEATALGPCQCMSRMRDAAQLGAQPQQDFCRHRSRETRRELTAGRSFDRSKNVGEPQAVKPAHHGLGRHP